MAFACAVRRDAQGQSVPARAVRSVRKDLLERAHAHVDVVPKLPAGLRVARLDAEAACTGRAHTR